MTTTPPTELELDEIETRANAATPGPWSVDSSIPYGHRVGTSDEADWVARTGDHGEDGSEADAAYIAALHPETAKALVAEVRRLRAEAQRLGELAARRESELISLREKHKAGLRRADQVNNELMEEVQRYAAGTERPVLWSVYNRMHLRAANAKARVAELECPAAEADTLPAWLYSRFMAGLSGVGWDNLDADDRAYWEHQARAVRRAVARGGFKAVAPDAASEVTSAPLQASQPSSVYRVRAEPHGIEAQHQPDGEDETPAPRPAVPSAADTTGQTQ